MLLCIADTGSAADAGTEVSLKTWDSRVTCHHTCVSSAFICDMSSMQSSHLCRRIHLLHRFAGHRTWRVIHLGYY